MSRDERLKKDRDRYWHPKNVQKRLDALNGDPRCKWTGCNHRRLGHYNSCPRHQIMDEKLEQIHYVTQHPDLCGDECITWVGTIHPVTGAVFCQPGKKLYVSVAKIILEFIGEGRKYYDKRHVTHTCGDKLCINPNHLKWRTRKVYPRRPLTPNLDRIKILSGVLEHQEQIIRYLSNTGTKINGTPRDILSKLHSIDFVGAKEEKAALEEYQKKKRTPRE